MNSSLPWCAVVVDRHLHKNGGSTLRQIFLQNARHDGWGFWGYSLHQHAPVARALALSIASSCNATSAASARAPIRLFVEYHYSRVTTRDILHDLGPHSPLQLAGARCGCRVVLMTRLREPTSFYISFYRWTVHWRQRANASEFGADLLEWAPRNLQSSILLRPLEATWAEYLGVRSELGQSRRRVYAQFDGEAGRARRAELRSYLRRFDLVGVLERFDETLLLLGELAGVQHLLYRAEAPLQTRPRARRVAVEEACPRMDACEARVRAAAPFDHALYAEHLARFDAAVRARGAPFQARLARFRRALRAFAALPPRQPRVAERHRLATTERHTLTPMRSLDCPLGEGFHAFDACRRAYADSPLRANWRVPPRVCCERLRQCARRAYEKGAAPCRRLWLPRRETIALSPPREGGHAGARWREWARLGGNLTEEQCARECTPRLGAEVESLERSVAANDSPPAAAPPPPPAPPPPRECGDDAASGTSVAAVGFEGCEKESARREETLSSPRAGCAADLWLRVHCRRSCGLCHLDGVAALLLPAEEALDAARAAAAARGVQLPPRERRKSKLTPKALKLKWIMRQLSIPQGVSASDTLAYAVFKKSAMIANASALTTNALGEIEGTRRNIELVVEALHGANLDLPE